MKKAYIVLSDYSTDASSRLKDIPMDVEIRSSIDRPNEDELCDLVNKYDVLIIGAREKMTPRVYKCANRLKVLGTLSIGMDHIHEAFQNDDGIRIINCPNSNVISVVEHTYACILALYKKLFVAHQATLSLAGRKGMGGMPLDICNKTLGVLGAGRIGSKVMMIAQAFGMKVVCHTQKPDDHRQLADRGVIFLPLIDVFKQADVISIHVPLTDRTKGFVSKEILTYMLNHSVLINTARVDLVDNIALAGLLKQGKIFGAAIDIDIEDVTTIDLYRNMHNVILTPHVAGLTSDAITRMDRELADQLYSLLKEQ